MNHAQESVDRELLRTTQMFGLASMCQIFFAL